MPRIRKHKRPAEQALLVSPWQQAKKDAHQQEQAPPPAALYSVATVDCVRRPAPHAQQRSSHDQQQQQQHPSPPPPAAVACTTTASAATTTAAADATHSSGWHQRPRRQQPTSSQQAPPLGPAASRAASLRTDIPPQQHLEPQPHAALAAWQQQQATAAHSAPVPTASTSTTGIGDAAPVCEDALEVTQPTWDRGGPPLGHPAASPSTAAPCHPTAPAPHGGELRGPAQLALLPDGRIAGCFAAAGPCGGAQLRLGLQGRQVLGLHSCYRDPEWALLQLAIIRPGSGGGGGSSSSSGSGSDGSNAGGSSGGASTGAGSLQGGPGDDALLLAACAAAGVGGNAADVAAALEAAGADAEMGGAAAAAAAAAAAPAAGQAGDPATLTAEQAEAVAWVQRTGGDLAALLPADFDDEDTELVVRAENLGELPPNIVVNFTPHTLQAGPRARAALLREPLRRWLPDWGEPAGSGQLAVDVLQGAVVNLGDMSISNLPRGFVA